MYVIGTAGHVDHGKSTLVHALTGIDPDRLQEEKDRGMTIDLGFAWLTLPSGKEVSIVDVPGHERFIKNMLAGVGAIDLALLVIAADEGVMPQTREHLAILDLLGIGHGAVVLTKRDLVDDEWLELVEHDVRELVDSTALEAAPILAVSATTGAGLPDLLAAIDRLLESTPIRRDAGRPRLPIDRVFTIAGFGTVVTGTLVDGTLKVGQEVEVLPQGVRTRIRGLQSHRTKVESIGPGTRVAANLAGVATDELHRGDVVTLPGWLRPTVAADVRLRLVSDLAAPLKHNASCTFHSLTTEGPAKVRLLGQPDLKPGESGWAQLRLEAPVALCAGDSFILRSSTGTIGGGTVVDAYPKRHKRFHSPTLNRLAALEQGSPEDKVLETIEKLQAVEMGALLKAGTVPEADAKVAVAALTAAQRAVLLGRAASPTAVLVTAIAWQRLVESASAALNEHHRQFPLRTGMAKEELRSRLRLPSRAAADAVDLMAQQGIIAERGAAVALPGHSVTFTPAQEQQAAALLQKLDRQPFTPLPELGVTDPDLVLALVEQGRLVRLAEDVCFPTATFDAMLDRVKTHLTANGKVTVAEVRDMFSTSRKYAIAFMEYLDHLHITRRVGDDRVLR